ncbi:MAG: type IX secretion system membrane protein PorP/SprF [Bacteroidia bacterium]
MKKIFTTIALSVAGLAAFSQQDAQFSQNMFNQLDINPAYAGINHAYCATLLGREQWVNFPGAPKTFLFSGDAYIPGIGGGLGLTAYSDQLGFDKTFGAILAYSYHIAAGPGVIGIGPELGIIQKSLSGAWLAPDGTNGASDNSIPVTGVSSMTYDVGLGVYYSIQDQMYFGISTSHIPQQSFTSGSYPSYQFDLARHYYVMAGYTFHATSDFDIMPSIFAKSDASSTQVDVNALIRYDKMVWIGVSYRPNDAIVALVGYQHSFTNGSTVRIGYSYDITTSELKTYSNGSHEIMLGYCFKIVPKSHIQSHQTVRFL